MMTWRMTGELIDPPSIVRQTRETPFSKAAKAAQWLERPEAVVSAGRKASSLDTRLLRSLIISAYNSSATCTLGREMDSVVLVYFCCD